MRKIITEIPPLSQKDCFYLVDRYKESFTYPLHKHDVYELNFVDNCRGMRRVVGDSIELLGDYDLALIGPGLEHMWDQYECENHKFREITIQFSSDLFGDTFLGKNQLSQIKKILENSKLGVTFSMSAIMSIYAKLNDLIRLESGFYKVLKFMEILHDLSMATDSRLLSSLSFARSVESSDSRRVSKVEEYIDKNFATDIRLQELANIVGMTPTAFSRFFRQRTGKTVSEYIIDIRLGHASRRLVDSTMSVLEICYECGFNNVSNFNRLFKKKKGCTPKIFRENYKKYKVAI